MSTPSSRVAGLVVGVSVTAVLVALWLASSAGLVGSYEDLEVYRYGAAAWWSGRDLYGPLPETSAGVALPFLYPPFAVVALSPLAVLPRSGAVAVLVGLDVLALLATVTVVLRGVAPSMARWRAVTCSACLLPALMLLEPVRQTVGFGQVNLLLMALVAIDCIVRRPRWPRGLGVGLAAATKLTALAFLVPFLARREWRPAGVAATTALLATALGFVLAPDASVRYWGEWAELTEWVRGSPFHTNQSIEAALARYEVDGPVSVVLGLGVASLLLVAVVVVARHCSREPALMTTAAFALVISPTSWTHHWVWAAPALVVSACLALAAHRRGSAALWAWAGTTVAGAALFIIAPPRLVPGAEDDELAWSVAEQVLGNAYTLFGVVLVLGAATTVVLRRAAPGRSTRAAGPRSADEGGFDRDGARPAPRCWPVRRPSA